MQYILHADGATAVADTLGGELISYKDSAGTQYLWGGERAYWSGHAPVLFPIVGALKNDTVTITGRPYSMPKHGFARKSEFVMQELHDGDITFVLTSNAEIKKMFPHDFTLIITHSINATGFSTKYRVCNDGVTAMGACIGGHVGLCCPLYNGERFDDYELKFDTPVLQEPLYTDQNSLVHKAQRKMVLKNGIYLPLRYKDYDNDVLIFDNIEARSIVLKNRLTQKGLRFDFQGFGNLGVWTPPDKQAPFICLEPWKGMPAFEDETGAFEDKPDTVWCRPKAMFSTNYSVQRLQWFLPNDAL